MSDRTLAKQKPVSTERQQCIVVLAVGPTAHLNIVHNLVDERSDSARAAKARGMCQREQGTSAGHGPAGTSLTPPHRQQCMTLRAVVMPVALPCARAPQTQRQFDAAAGQRGQTPAPPGHSATTVTTTPQPQPVSCASRPRLTSWISMTTGLDPRLLQGMDMEMSPM